MSLPTHIPRVKEGDFISADHYNTLVSICEALMRGEGRNGVKFFPAEAGFVWRGSGTGSADTEPSGGGGGSAVAFRGHWNTLTSYDEGDVVFVASAADQAELAAHTYVSKQSSNLNHVPPDTITAYEDAWWRVVSIGSWPTFVVGNPQIKPTDERLVTLVPGAAQFHFSGSGDTGDAANDVTEIVGGVVTVGGRVLVTGPLNIEFPDDTKVIIDVGDLDQVGSELNGQTFKLRTLPYCDQGVERSIGVLCTEPFDL